MGGAVAAGCICRILESYALTMNIKTSRDINTAIAPVGVRGENKY